MRMSVQKTSPWYHPEWNKYHVLVDGKKLPWCFAACEDSGIAFYWEKDDNGAFIISRGELVITSARGVVKIVRSEDEKT